MVAPRSFLAIATLCSSDTALPCAWRIISLGRTDEHLLDVGCVLCARAGAAGDRLPPKFPVSASSPSVLHGKPARFFPQRSAR